MTVRSLHDVMNNFARSHLEQIIPDDVDVVYDVGVVLYPSACPDCGDEHCIEMFRVALSVTYPPDTESQQQVFTTSVLFDYDDIEDGDTDPLAECLDELWQEITSRVLGQQIDAMLGDTG